MTSDKLSLQNHIIPLLAALLALSPSMLYGAEVTIKSYAFNPGAATAKPGEQVVWHNEDRARHNVVIDGQTSPALKQGERFSFVPKAAGEYPYHCSLHPGMKGVLVVGDGAAAAAKSTAATPTAKKDKPVTAASGGKNVVQIVDFMRFEPVELVISQGQSVTWINHDGSNHKIQFADSVSQRMRHDASYSKTFDKPGSYDYVCAIHGDKMSGKVIVKAAN